MDHTADTVWFLLTIVTRVYSQKGFPEAYYADLDIPKSQYLA